MRLPPLNAIRVFEAAGRSCSFLEAGRELHVTPAAVSQQIKLLEDRLKVKLFRRLHRRLELTPAGAALLPHVVEAFDRLEQAISQVSQRGSKVSGRLNLGIPTAFGSNWLMPRLPMLQNLFPNMELHISAKPTMSDEVRKASVGVADAMEGNDLVVRFGHGDYPGLFVQKLFELHATPLCSPSLIGGRDPLRDPKDILNCTLLHIENDVFSMDQRWPKWDDWLEVVGIGRESRKRGLVFNQVALAIEAAADRMGIVLGIPLLASEELNNGRLIAPFPYGVTMSDSYYLVSASGNVSGAVVAFRDWMIGEAERDAWARPPGAMRSIPE